MSGANRAGHVAVTRAQCGGKPNVTYADYAVLFLKALLLTDAIETVVLFLVIRLWFRIGRSELSNSLLLFAGIFCSATTLPYLWFVLRWFIAQHGVFLAVGEPAVFLVEAVFYYFVLKIGVKRSLAVSFLCNLASFLIGQCIPHSWLGF
jgi:hypothetical protein